MGNVTDQGQSSAATELRRHAEKRWRAKTAVAYQPRTREETERVVHELEVHQIELEMQNAELHQARNEVESILEKYTDLYDFAPVGYCTLALSGDIISANLSCASLLGLERSLLLGRNFAAIVSEECRPGFSAFLTKVFSSRGKESCEAALLINENVPVTVQIEAITNSSGQECRLALIDITGRRRMEEKIEILHSELASRAIELESANIELEAFNYSVSHNLRRPLTVINGYCQAIQAMYGSSLDDKCLEYIKEMFEGTLRMNLLISTLLDFSTVKHVKISREMIDLSKMADTVALELKLSEPERRVVFRITAGIVACGDPALLKVVLDNLIGNAWKYTRDREVADIEVGVTEVAEKPVCYVRDNGHGFAMVHADKLFIPFQRLPGAEEFRGHGIGLATVERIITRHGGRVWAEGEPGKGATFYFTLSGEGIYREDTHS